MRREYGVDLLDLWRGSLSLRQVHVLISGLPKDCALTRARDPDNSGWTLMEHLLAGLFDSSQFGNWQRAGDAKLPRPKRLPRPGVLDEAKAAASHTERNALAFQQRQREREAGN